MASQHQCNYRVPPGVEVWVAKDDPARPEIGFIMRPHKMKDDLYFVDFMFAAVPSEPQSKVKFRVRDGELRWKGRNLMFHFPKGSTLHQKFGIQRITFWHLDGEEFVIVATGDNKYPFVICKKALLQAA